MTVDLQLLQRAIKSLYRNVNPVQDKSENTLVFAIKLQHYFTFAALRIHTSFSSEIEHMQALCLTFVFTDTDGEALNVGDKDYAEVAVLCTRLQELLEWGTISPCNMHPGVLEIALHRKFNTSEVDLKLAIEEDMASELVSSLIHLSQEFEHIAAVLQNFVTSDTFDPNLIAQILEPTMQTVYV